MRRLLAFGLLAGATLTAIACGVDGEDSPFVTPPEEAGVEVLNQAFVAKGNVATAGGCLASQYLAAWVIARLEGIEAAKSAMHSVGARKLALKVKYTPFFRSLTKRYFPGYDRCRQKCTLGRCRRIDQGRLTFHAVTASGTA